MFANITVQIGSAWLLGARFDLAFADIKKSVAGFSKAQPSPVEGHSEL